MTEKFKRLFLQHWLKFSLVVGVFLVFFIYIDVHLFRIHNLGSLGQNYYPLSILEYNEEVFSRLAIIREIYEGHFPPGDIVIYENFGSPPILPFYLSFLLLSLPLFITNSVTWTLILDSSLFPAIIFLFIFWLLYLLTKKKILSLLFSIFLMVFANFGSFLFIVKGSILYSIKATIKAVLPILVGNSYTSYDLFKTMPALSPGFIFFILALVALFLSVKFKDKKYWILLGLSWGLLFYTYFYHWVYFSIAWGTIILIFYWRDRDKILIKNGLLSCLLAAVISIPYWVQYFQLAYLPTSQEFYARLPIEIGRGFKLQFLPQYFYWLLLSALIYFVGKNNGKLKEGWFVIGLLITNFITLNLNIVIGFLPLSVNFLIRAGFFVVDLAVVLLICWAMDLLCRRYRKIYFFSFVILVIIILSSVLHAVVFSSWEGKRNLNRFTLPAGLADSFEWLNKNTPLDSVVMTPSITTNTFLPTYTHNKNYFARGPMSVISDRDNLDRLYNVYKFFNISEKYLVQSLEKSSVNSDYNYESYEKTLSFYLFGEKFDFKEIAVGDWRPVNTGVPVELLGKIIEDFQKINFSIASLKKYKVDYVYYGPFERMIQPKIDFSSIKYLKKIYDKDGVQIFSFEQN